MVMELGVLDSAVFSSNPFTPSRYLDSVERLRDTVRTTMPSSLRRRPDAEMLIDKALFVAQGESAGDPNAVGDGGAAAGLWQSHYIPHGSTVEDQARDMWRLVSKNPDQFTDWGEGVLYDAGDGRGPQPFGALGRTPYGGAAAGASGGVEAGGAGAGTSSVTSQPSGFADSVLNTGSAGNAGNVATAADTGEFPVAAGQGQPGTMGIAEVMQRAGLGGTDYGSKITGALTGEVPFANEVKGAVETAFDTSVPGTRGLLKPGDLVPGAGMVNRAVNTARAGASRLGVDLPSGGEVLAGQVPTTPLDIGLTIGPNNIVKGVKLAGSGGVGLGIIGDASSVAKRALQAKRQYDALLKAGQSEAEIVAMLGQDAVNLAKGGSASVKAVEAATDLTGAAQSRAARNVYERTLEATGDPGAATEAARAAAGAEAGATTRLRGTAGALSERMGPGVVDEGASGVAGAGGALARTADDVPAGAILDAEGNLDMAATLADEAQRIAREGVTPATADNLAGLATAAKRLGDPASEIRRQLQQGGGAPDTVNAATNQPVLPGMPAPAMAARNAAQIPHESAVSKAGGIISGVLGAPRALALSLDWGVVRDLSILGSSRRGAPAALEGARRGGAAYLSEDAAKATQDLIKNSDLYKFVTDGSNFKRPAHFYEYGEGVAPELRVPEMSSLGDNPVSRVVSDLPHVKMSDRALAVQRNVAGLALLESREAELAAQFGQGSERYYREMQSTIDSVNHLRGYSGGKVAKGLGVLNSLTSPQQMISRLQVIGDPINMLLRGDTASAKFAAETLLGFASSQTALMALLKITGSQAGGRWSVNANPLDGDFGQLKIGNSRYDTLAGLGPIIKTGARIAAVTSDAAFDTDFAKNHANVKDLVEQWITNKENPTARLFYDMAKKMELPDVETLAGLIAPSIAMGIMQDIRDNRGANKLLAVPNAAANFVGVGTNTYQTAADHADAIAQQTYEGRKYDDLTPVERLRVVDVLPEEAQRSGRAAERKLYNERLDQAGYNANGADTTKLDRENPELDVQHWYWDKDKHDLHSLDAVQQALDSGVADREVKFAGLPRPVNQDDKSRQAFEASGKLMDWYLNTVVEQNADTYIKFYAGQKDGQAFRLPQGSPKKLSELSDDARGKITRAIHERAEDPEVKAWLVYWGKREVPKGTTDEDKKVRAQYLALTEKYGNKPVDVFKSAVVAGVREAGR